MGLFRNPQESHEHSLKILNTLYEYDSFLDSLTVVADMGCGSGLDAKWWATLETRDNPPEPRNYTVYAVDKDISRLDPSLKKLKNIIPLEGNFEERIIPRKVDLIWAHDVFQSAQDPYKTLASWKETMSVNGMLVLSIPQTTFIDHTTKQLIISNHSHQYYNYNILNLMYMLAISGFDTRDAYFYREPNTPWVYAAVYASEHGPQPEASWDDLAAKGLVNDSLMDSLNRWGHARLNEMVVQWLDKNNYIITD